MYANSHRPYVFISYYQSKRNVKWNDQIGNSIATGITTYLEIMLTESVLGNEIYQIF